MNETVVSIWCSAYNHEAYISDAIEGFLMQKTSFKYEIIIHDDASTDRTPEIIRRYEAKYPEMIHGIYQINNQWSQNWPSVAWMNQLQIQNCKGKYIAFCEGDDYWIDMQKLQLQVDYLEKHSECMMVIHDAIDIDCRTHKVKSKSLYAKDCLLQPEEIITQRHLQVPTASMLFRSEIMKMKGCFLHAGIGDYTHLLYCLTKGNIYYFSRIMSAYRYCHKGSWTTLMSDNMDKRIIQLVLTIDFLEKYNEYSKKIYEDFVISKVQICVDDILYSFGLQTLESTLKLCTEYDRKTKGQYCKTFNQIKRVCQQIYNDNYLDEKIFHFCNKYKKIFVMGAGKYAGIIAKQLRNNNIEFEGFVISNNKDNPQIYLGKPVWKLKNISFELKDIGIIIGINPIIWDQIIDSLRSVNIYNYICPFLLDKSI